MDEKHFIVMNRLDAFEGNDELKELFKKFSLMYNALGRHFLKELDRMPAFTDMVVDRWDKAKSLGFGEGTNIYDNALVIGDVKVGKECWIGPNTIIDGSGGLKIGDYCTVSAGVQIYSHDNVKQTLSAKGLPIERKPTRIGNNVYIGPQAVITKGVDIGNNVIIGSFALINKNIPNNAIVMGQPGIQVGIVEKNENGEITYKYFDK